MQLSVNGNLRTLTTALVAISYLLVIQVNVLSGQTSSRRNYLSEKPKSILVSPRVAKNLTPAARTTVSNSNKANSATPKRKYQPQDFGIQPIQSLKVDTRSKYPDSIPDNHAANLLAKEKKIEYASDPIDYEFVQTDRPASDIAHQPLYFEELNLERHGTKLRCLQPLASGARFVASATLLPYKMTRQPPRQHVRNCDPNPSGLPASWVKERGRVSPLGAANEFAAIAAVLMIIP